MSFQRSILVRPGAKIVDNVRKRFQVLYAMIIMDDDVFVRKVSMHSRKPVSMVCVYECRLIDLSAVDLSHISET